MTQSIEALSARGKRIRTTDPQRQEMSDAFNAPNVYRNEKVWTYLVADLLANAPDPQSLIKLLCGRTLTARQPFDVWFEAQPLPPRQGTLGDSEGNTKVDLGTTYEELLAHRFGVALDIVDSPSTICGMKEHLEELAVALHAAAQTP